MAAEANDLLLNNGDANLIALLAIRSLTMQYTSSGDAVLSSLTTLQSPPSEFKGHTLDIWGVAFSPDGRYTLTASNANTARLWLTDLDETVQAGGAFLTRDLTPEERIQCGVSDQKSTGPAR